MVQARTSTRYDILSYIAFSIERALFRKLYGILVYVESSIEHGSSKKIVRNSSLYVYR